MTIVMDCIGGIANENADYNDNYQMTMTAPVYSHPKTKAGVWLMGDLNTAV